MTPKRRIFAHVLIFAVILGSAYDIATRQEHWPFSDYPMFSTIHRATVLEWPRLFGVTADGSEVALGRSRLPLAARSITPADRPPPPLPDRARPPACSRGTGRLPRPVRAPAGCRPPRRTGPPRHPAVHGRVGHPAVRVQPRSAKGARADRRSHPACELAARRESKMRAAARAWHRFWFRPASPADLAVARLVFFGGLALFLCAAPLCGLERGDAGAVAADLAVRPLRHPRVLRADRARPGNHLEAVASDVGDRLDDDGQHCDERRPRDLPARPAAQLRTDLSLRRGARTGVLDPRLLACGRRLVGRRADSHRAGRRPAEVERGVPLAGAARAGRPVVRLLRRRLREADAHGAAVDHV